MFHNNKMGSIIRTSGIIFNLLLYLNYNGLKYSYSVISVIDNSLLGNTGARQAEGLEPRSSRAPLALSQSQYDFPSKQDFWPQNRVEPV